jgi:CRISPR-associated protein Csm5
MLMTENDNLFKNFLISDANANDRQSSAIATVTNVKRNIERTGISNRLEVILTSKIFNTVVKINEPLKFNEIASSCNEHYLPIFRSMFDDKTDSNTLKEINFDFVQKYKNYQPKNNQFLLRIGHHSGGRATSIDGMRAIRVKTQKGHEFRKEETTIWLYKGNNGKFLPLGWVLCEYDERDNG